MDNKIEFKHKSWSVCLSLPVGYQKKPLVFFFDTLSEGENFIKNNYTYCGGLIWIDGKD